MIQVDLQNIRSFIPLPYEAALSPRLRIAHDHLQNGDGAGGEFTGWVRLPEDYDKAEFARIKAAADPQAIFCFSPPEREKTLLSSRFVRFNCSETSFTRFRISASSNPWFSHPKAISLVVSTLKN